MLFVRRPRAPVNEQNFKLYDSSWKDLLTIRMARDLYVNIAVWEVIAFYLISWVYFQDEDSGY